MSVAKKALLIWWGVGFLMAMILVLSFQFDAIRPTGGPRDIGLLVAWMAVWGYFLNRLATTHKNSKSEGATK